MIFRNWVLQNFPFLEDNFDALTDYELFCKMMEYVLQFAKDNEEFKKQLAEYQHYFENLDVQEEINNKLDEMAESGELEEIIGEYLNARALLVFDTVADMKEATNLINGSYVRTLGFYSINDGGGATYKITDTGTNNDSDVISVSDLFAHLIYTDEMNLTQFGVDYTSDDVTDIVNYVIGVCSLHKIKLLIPAHTYMFKTLLTHESDGHTYNYFIKAIQNIEIEGVDKYNSVFKISSTVDSYNSVFFNDEETSNVVLNNFTIEQYYESGAEMPSGTRANRKVAFILYGVANDITIKNIFFKNCCGVNVIAFHDSVNIKNVNILDNIFDYYHVDGISYYDRSIMYLECHDYKVLNNTIYGNFETNGGIECHGYNGLCKNNIIYKCATGVNVAPRFSDSIGSANIEVSSNVFSDNTNAIKLWNNTDGTSTLGCKGVIITNNNIQINGYVIAQDLWKSNGTYSPSAEISGINTYFTNSAKIFSDIIISNNIVSLKGYSSYTSYTASNATNCSGIALCGNNTMNNIHIVNNHVEGIAGSGIAIGDNRSSADSYPTIRNVVISDNTVVNCGYSTQNVNPYKAFILLRLGNMYNIIVKNNILIKTDNSYNTTYVFCNQINTNSTKENIYYIGNIATSVVSSVSEFGIDTGNQHVIIERGTTTNRPAIALKGDTYYDTTLNKLIAFDGTNWINVDGSSLT